MAERPRWLPSGFLALSLEEPGKGIALLPFVLLWNISLKFYPISFSAPREALCVRWKQKDTDLHFLAGVSDSCYCHKRLFRHKQALFPKQTLSPKVHLCGGGLKLLNTSVIKER